MKNRPQVSNLKKEVFYGVKYYPSLTSSFVPEMRALGIPACNSLDSQRERERENEGEREKAIALMDKSQG